MFISKDKRINNPETTHIKHYASGIDINKLNLRFLILSRVESMIDFTTRTCFWYLWHEIFHAKKDQMLMCVYVPIVINLLEILTWDQNQLENYRS